MWLAKPVFCIPAKIPNFSQVIAVPSVRLSLQLDRGSAHLFVRMMRITSRALRMTEWASACYPRFLPASCLQPVRAASVTLGLWFLLHAQSLTDLLDFTCDQEHLTVNYKACSENLLLFWLVQKNSVHYSGKLHLPELDWFFSICLRLLSSLLFV